MSACPHHETGVPLPEPRPSPRLRDAGPRAIARAYVIPMAAIVFFVAMLFVAVGQSVGNGFSPAPQATGPLPLHKAVDMDAAHPFILQAIPQPERHPAPRDRDPVTIPDLPVLATPGAFDVTPPAQAPPPGGTGARTPNARAPPPSV